MFSIIVIVTGKISKKQICSLFQGILSALSHHLTKVMKNKLETGHLMKEDKNLKYYKRSINKQILQVSGLCSALRSVWSLVDYKQTSPYGNLIKVYIQFITVQSASYLVGYSQISPYGHLIIVYIQFLAGYYFFFIYFFFNFKILYLHVYSYNFTVTNILIS